MARTICRQSKKVKWERENVSAKWRERQREKQESVRIERDINNSRMTHRKTFVVFAISIDAFIWEFGVMAAVGQSRIENPQSYSERQLNESNLLQNNVN